MMYNKEAISDILLSSNIRDLYQVPTNDEDFVIFIVPRKLNVDLETRLRKAIQKHVGCSCCLVSTEFDIQEEYCVFNNGKWVA